LIVALIQKLDCQSVNGLLNLNADLLNSINLADKIDCCVEGLVSDEIKFSALLGMANSKCDKRVRFQWVDFALEQWKMGDHKFDAAVGVDLIESVPSITKFMRTLHGCLKPNGLLVLFESKLLEPINGFSLQTLKKYGYELVSYERCSDAIAIECKHFTADYNKSIDNTKSEIAQQWKAWSSTHANWTVFTLKSIDL